MSSQITSAQLPSSNTAAQSDQKKQKDENRQSKSKPGINNTKVKRALTIFVVLFALAAVVGGGFLLLKGNGVFDDDQEKAAKSHDEEKSENGYEKQNGQKNEREDAKENLDAEFILEFTSGKGYQIKFKGENDPEDYCIYDRTGIKEVLEYSSEEEMLNKIYEDYEWSNYIFYLPATDAYYLIEPGGVALINIVSKSAVEQEFIGTTEQNLEDGGKSKEVCNLRQEQFEGIDVKLTVLVCEYTYMYEDVDNTNNNYSSTTSSISWLYELDEKYFLMGEFLSAPVGSDVDARWVINGTASIEVI
jgi:hypothetical protein